MPNLWSDHYRLMTKYRILHITKDDKFFDGVYNAFETDERLENKAVLEVNQVEGYQFRRIKNGERIRLVDRTGMKAVLKLGEYDAVFFYSLSMPQYDYFRWIPKDKKVIWWCWGYELYENSDGTTPLIRIPLYQPLTEALRQVLNSDAHGWKHFIKVHLLRHIRDHKRAGIIRRIDYFQPVIPLEYQLMHKVKGFRAKEFYYPLCFTNKDVDFAIKHLTDGSVLMGNSASETNNHLDAWDKIKDYIPTNRKIVFPLNYGHMDYADAICNRIISNNHELLFLRDFLPCDDYWQLIDSCSYAVFGVMRQQAMGNILHCLTKGIKVFLYRDSLVYRFLKEWGYAVYAIEDIDEQSFKTTLTEAELLQNAKAFAKEAEYIMSVREMAFREIIPDGD